MKNGPYEMIIAPSDYPGKKYRDRYAYQHTVVWWQNNNSIPPVGYEIHHLNGNHRDNRIENLQLVTVQEHKKIHGAINKAALIQYNCSWCGILHSRTGKNYRFQLKNNKSGKLFCSKSCGTKYQHSIIKKEGA